MRRYAPGLAVLGIVVAFLVWALGLIGMSTVEDLKAFAPVVGIAFALAAHVVGLAAGAVGVAISVGLAVPGWILYWLSAYDYLPEWANSISGGAIGVLVIMGLITVIPAAIGSVIGWQIALSLARSKF